MVKYYREVLFLVNIWYHSKLRLKIIRINCILRPVKAGKVISRYRVYEILPTTKLTKPIISTAGMGRRITPLSPAQQRWYWPKVRDKD